MESVRSVGEANMPIAIGSDTGTGVVVRPFVDADDLSPEICLVIVRATANGRDRVQPDNVCLAIQRQDFIGPVV